MTVMLLELRTALYVILQKTFRFILREIRIMITLSVQQSIENNFFV